MDDIMILRLIEAARVASPAIHKLVLDCIDRARDYDTDVVYEIQCLTRFDRVDPEVCDWFAALGIA